MEEDNRFEMFKIGVKEIFSAPFKNSLDGITHVLCGRSENTETRFFEYSWWDVVKMDMKFGLEAIEYALFPNKWIWKNVFWLHHYGYQPLAIVKSYNFERTFLFKTEEEAQACFDELEGGDGKSITVGWYYALDDFKELIEDCDTYTKDGLEIYWVQQEYKEFFYNKNSPNWLDNIKLN